MLKSEFNFSIGDVVRTPTSVGIIYDIKTSERTGQIIVDVISVKNVFKQQTVDPLQGEMIEPATHEELSEEFEKYVSACRQQSSNLVAYANNEERYRFSMSEARK